MGVQVWKRVWCDLFLNTRRCCRTLVDVHLSNTKHTHTFTHSHTYTHAPETWLSVTQSCLHDSYLICTNDKISILLTGVCLCANARTLCVSLQAYNCKLNRGAKLWAHGSRPNLADGSPNLSMEPLLEVRANAFVQLHRDRYASKASS